MSSDSSTATMILDLLRAATTSGDLQAVIDDIGQELARLVQFDRLSLILPEPKSDLAVSYVFTTDSPGERLRLPMNETSIPSVMAGNCLLVDIAESPHPAERALASRYGLSTAIFAPLVARGEVIGVMAISSLEADAYDVREVRDVCEVAEYLGVVVEHALLSEQAKRADVLSDRLRLASRSYHELTMGLNELVWAIEKDDTASADLAIRTLLESARNAQWDLEPAVLEEVAVVNAIAALAATLEATGPVVTIDLDGEQPPSMDRRCSAAMVHVASVGLDNVRAHSSAHRVAIHIGFATGEATVEVTDNGTGFDVDQLQSHHGLSILKRRVEQVGGSIEVRSAPGVGTKVVAAVPYQPVATDTGAVESAAETGSEEAFSVIVAADREVMRRGLADMVDSTPGVSLAATAADGRSLVEVAGTEDAQVVLLGVDLVDPDPDMLAELPPVIVMSTSDRDPLVFPWLEAGAKGHLTTDVMREELRRAVAVVASGDSLLAPITTKRLLDRLDTAVDRLTERELEVLEVLATGASNKDIGNRLFIGTGTVKFHVANILRKLQADNRTQAVATARERGLLG